jgi:hypothetical protein
VNAPELYRYRAIIPTRSENMIEIKAIRFAERNMNG